MKRIIALLIALIMLVLFVSCDNGNKKQNEEIETTTCSETQTEPETTDETAETQPMVETTNESAVNKSEESAESTTAATKPIEPSQWSDKEIIDFYKKAAEKSNSKAKSNQIMVLDELIINDGDGALGFFIRILEPAIASVIKKNAFDFDGITGGFANLQVSDAKSIKAYKSGEYTVVEMTMKEQTDGIHGDAYAGSVGHAITVLGDISKVLAEFPQFDVDVENADIDVHYVDATVKVKINKDGIIEKGTWKYTCDPEIRHLDISGIMIDKADAKIDYIITVGGGF
ncbi:MAG: hypothetical protein IJ264_07690 [Clostridia bacterium]|nr:hypothetical protein [Clostridia bacterium]